ncbi:winged helix-turn-helix transcriptional regulator [Pseudooceanicola sediminis]|uniref:Winged helix-turn-helix transcriptional regulator n=1 Tax=Pseudooceanicola sediminis TaxID=2211117 RepID=A0A399J5W2_9RHOB|nr:helix-turn-helix domain-containing protein [Pseudooceanicola sediminis]RII38186.1 winged helix-turn-helix transcriptional regulator [Pseudooceanicola sediminis]
MSSRRAPLSPVGLLLGEVVPTMFLLKAKWRDVSLDEMGGVMKRIESLRRGLKVMDLLQAAGPLSLAELARATGIDKATLLRILATLEEEAHARRGLGDGLWYAATRDMVAPAADTLLAQVSAPVLDRLCQKALWPSDVGVYHDGSIQILETSRRLSPFLVNRVVNYDVHVLPSAMGRAILAWSAPETRAEILTTLASRNSPHDRLAGERDRVARLIDETLTRGYAIRHPGYFVAVRREATVSAIAVPVLSRGVAIGAVNLSWVARAQSEADIASAHLEDLRRAAAEIAKAIPLPRSVSGTTDRQGGKDRRHLARG